MESVRHFHQTKHTNLEKRDLIMEVRTLILVLTTFEGYLRVVLGFRVEARTGLRERSG